MRPADRRPQPDPSRHPPETPAPRPRNPGRLSRPESTPHSHLAGAAPARGRRWLPQQEFPHARRQPIYAQPVRRQFGRRPGFGRRRRTRPAPSSAGMSRCRRRRIARTGTNSQSSASRQAARHELSSGLRPRPRPRLAGTRPRQHRRHHPVEGVEQSGRAATADEQARLLRFIGFGASDLAQNCFRRPGEDAFRAGWEEKLARRSKPPSRRRNTPPCNAPRKYRHRHAGDDHPRPLARRRTARLRRRAGAGTLLDGTAVLRAAAGGAARCLPAYRHRIRPGDRPHRPAGASAGAGALRRLHPQHSVRAVRSRHRQSAVPRPRGAGRSRHPRRPAAGCTTTSSAARSRGALWRHCAVRHQHRHDGQGRHDGPRPYRRHGRPRWRGAPARRQHAGRRRHQCGCRSAGVPAPCFRPTSGRCGLDRSRDGQTGDGG